MIQIDYSTKLVEWSGINTIDHQLISHRLYEFISVLQSDSSRSAQTSEPSIQQQYFIETRINLHASVVSGKTTAFGIQNSLRALVTLIFCIRVMSLQFPYCRREKWVIDLHFMIFMISRVNTLLMF